MRSGDFDAVVTTETELRELCRMPADLTERKKLTALDVRQGISAQ